jgi:hypothetical protein
LELSDQTLAQFGPVTPRAIKAQPLPYRGAGVRPDGGVRLIAYNRADNGLAFSVLLSKGDWAEWVPPQVAVGTRWRVSDAVARAFAPVLSPYADTRFRPRPEDLTAAELTTEVESIDRQLATIRLNGRWRADWTHDGNEHSLASATAEGIAVFDTEKKVIRSLLLVFDGTYSYTSRPGQSPRSQPCAAVIRWKLEGEAE